MKILIVILLIPVVVLVVAFVIFTIYRVKKRPGKTKNNGSEDTKKLVANETKKEIPLKKEAPKTKESSGSFRKFLKLIGGITLALIALYAVGLGIRYFFSAIGDKGSIFSQTSVTNLSHGVPADIALRVIAECESGGKQFEADGKTPTKNKGIPEKGVEPSSAFGKYQFLESHREPAKKLGFDLNTETGQDGYARYRYSQTATKDWEFDEEYGGGKACWEPKLRTYTWGGGEAVAITVVAPTEGWSDSIPTPYAPRRWELEGFGKKYRVLWNGEDEEDFPQAQRVEKRDKIIYNFRFKSRELEPVNIVVKFF